MTPKLKVGDIVFQVDSKGKEQRFVILEVLNKTYRYINLDTDYASSAEFNYVEKYTELERKPTKLEGALK